MKKFLLFLLVAMSTAVATPARAQTENFDSFEDLIVADSIDANGAQTNFGHSWWWIDDEPASVKTVPWHSGLNLPGLGR